MIDVSIVLPVHNEAEGIEMFITDLISTLKKSSFTYQIICVENGSTDSSLKKLHTLQKKYKKLRVIQSEKGWGNAVRAGIVKAEGKYTCYMVSDGQIDPITIHTLYNDYKNYSDYSLLKVWRTGRENILRLIVSRLYNMIAYFMLGIRSCDINATPKLIETKLLQSIPFTSHNIGLDVELLWHLKKRHLGWKEIPTASKKRESGVSTTKIASIIEMLQCIVSLALSGRAQ